MDIISRDLSSLKTSVPEMLNIIKDLDHSSNEGLLKNIRKREHILLKKMNDAINNTEAKGK